MPALASRGTRPGLPSRRIASATALNEELGRSRCHDQGGGAARDRHLVAWRIAIRAEHALDRGRWQLDCPWAWDDFHVDGLHRIEHAPCDVVQACAARRVCQRNDCHASRGVEAHEGTRAITAAVAPVVGLAVHDRAPPAERHPRVPVVTGAVECQHQSRGLWKLARACAAQEQVEQLQQIVRGRAQGERRVPCAAAGRADRLQVHVVSLRAPVGGAVIVRAPRALRFDQCRSDRLLAHQLAERTGRSHRRVLFTRP